MKSLKILEDLGRVYLTKNSKHKTHYIVYECPGCKQPWRLDKRVVTAGKFNVCKSCNNKSRAAQANKNHRCYNTWANQRIRCNTKSNPSYKNYGGRGISQSKEFADFKVWAAYVETLDNYGKEGYTLDRVNNDGNYERGNLRWASKETQMQNTRKIQINNTSGYRGVFKYKTKWKVQIHNEGKIHYLGVFTNKEEAATMYDNYVIDNGLEHTLNFKRTDNGFK